MAKKPLGKVTHFYDKISVAVVALNAGLKAGDKIKIGKQEPYAQLTVRSMQINRDKIEKAKKNQEIGLKVRKKARVGDLVFKI